MKPKPLLMTDSEISFFKAFGRRLAELRKQRGMTQTDLGEALGLNQTAVASYEVGRRRVPLSLLPDLANLLGVSAAELIEAPEPSGKPGPTPKLQRQIDQVSQLPKGKQKFVSDFLETFLASETQQAKAS
jgi:transcriptional regulator with XRE-family HTH domain